MAAAELAQATLLCRDESWRPEHAAMIVDGLEIPGSAPMLRPSAERRPIEIELAWPQPMLDELGEFYKDVFVKGIVDEWNCHIFGATVTHNIDSLVMDNDWVVVNAVPGRVVDPEQTRNQRLYGLFQYTGDLAHTLVGTQKPGMCLQVWSYRNTMRYGPAKGTQNFYKGTLRQYDFDRSGLAVAL